MRILVIDVAAEHGGAVTILNQFLSEFESDSNNEYYVVLSKLKYQERANIKFINTEWVKKTPAHRLFFDYFYARKLAKQVRADMILSLQNKTVSAGKIRQEVYFHNALPISEKRFTAHEAPKIWVYQNVLGNMIRRSLCKADAVYVQADWIRKALMDKWRIQGEKIVVKRPAVVHNDQNEQSLTDRCIEKHLFYPAALSIYKNHAVLIKACVLIWDKYGCNCGLELTLTCRKENLPKECSDILARNQYPVHFSGRLDASQMAEMYRTTTLVFPSYIETVGLPLIEAQVYGGMILAADCEYAHEAIGDYAKAVYFDPYDEEKIADQIIRTLDLDY